MNWNGLFKVMCSLGIVLIIIGGVVYVLNRPLVSGDGVLSPVMDAYNYTENRRRDETRGTAMYLLIGGVVVAFTAVGGMVALKKT